MIDIFERMDTFLGSTIQKVDVYNEFSLQHEIGIFLRNSFPNYKVQFERNISYFGIHERLVKKEIDISIFSLDKSEKYAIELKYPLSGQFPEQMFSFVIDVKFMEQLKLRGFTKTFCVVLVKQPLFYDGREQDGIYKYFRKEHAIYGCIYKPTGKLKNSESVLIDGIYDFRWNDTPGKDEKFYIIEI